MNFAPLSFLAASRTRSSALGVLSWRCVQCTFCWSAFPPARLLPSTASAAGCPALFGGFAGTTSLSDFLGSFIFGLRLGPSRRGRRHHYRRRPEDLPVPVQRGSARAWGLRPRRAAAALAIFVPQRVAFRRREERRRPGLRFRGSIASPCVPLSTLRPRPFGRWCMTRGDRDSLGLRSTVLSSFPLCRSPGALPSLAATRPRLRQLAIRARVGCGFLTAGPHGPLIST